MCADHASALAAAVLGLGGVGFLATKLDPGFADVFREAVVKVMECPPSSSVHVHVLQRNCAKDLLTYFNIRAGCQISHAAQLT